MGLKSGVTFSRSCEHVSCFVQNPSAKSQSKEMMHGEVWQEIRPQVLQARTFGGKMSLTIMNKENRDTLNATLVEM